MKSLTKNISLHSNIKKIQFDIISLFLVILISCISLKSEAQNFKYGATAGYNYNISSMYTHLSLSMLYKESHKIELGYLTGAVASDFGEESGKFENFELGSHKIDGLKFGYKYIFLTPSKWDPILNFDFATYQVERNENRRVPNQTSNSKVRIIENSLSIGANYRIVKGLYGCVAAGIGSYNGFFLMVDSFLFKGQISLEYYF